MFKTLPIYHQDPTRAPAVPDFFFAVKDTLLIGEAPWNKDLVNCVSIIGRLAKPLEIKTFPNFQVAATGISITLPSAF